MTRPDFLAKMWCIALVELSTSKLTSFVMSVAARTSSPCVRTRWWNPPLRFVKTAFLARARQAGRCGSPWRVLLPRVRTCFCWTSRQTT